MYFLKPWIPPDTCPGVWLLKHMVALFLVFEGASILFSIVAAPIYIPTNSVRGFPFLHTLSNIIIDFLIMAVPTGVKWYFIVVFNFIFLIVMLSIFSCASWPPVCLLQRNVYLALPPHNFLWGCLFFLILSCISCLYILEINSLSVASFAIFLSHSEGCLFTLLIVFFIVQTLLSLIRSHLFIFAFISIKSRGAFKEKIS